MHTEMLAHRDTGLTRTDDEHLDLLARHPDPPLLRRTRYWDP
jgi:hypothetical protein